MAINWSLLGPALQANPSEAFTRGMEGGVTRSALGALAQNPNDERAMSALAAFNPQAAMQMQQQRVQSQTAAMQQRRLAAQAQEDEIKNTQDMILAGASFLEGVQDEAGYQQARQRFLQAFPNGPQPPEQFDQTYVGNVRTTAQQLQAYRARASGRASGGAQAMTTFQRELAGAGIFPGSPAYAAAIANRMQPPYMVVPQGGQTQRNPGWVDPMSLSGTPPGQAIPGQQPQVVDALPPGFVFEDEGGPEQTAPETFPADEWQPVDSSSYPPGQW